MAKSHPINNIRNHISLATATYYPFWPIKTSDKVRGDLALESFGEIKKKNLPLFISDGGSSKSFLQEVSNLGYTIYKQKDPGLSAGRRQALTKASLRKDSIAICLFEPEKVSFIKNCLIRSVQPILKDQTEIVIPKRNEKSFSSYPDNQAISEKTLNSLMASIITDSLKKKGKLVPPKINEIDFAFGPKVLLNKPQILDLFMDKYASKKVFEERKFQCETWANALFFPIFVALLKGLKVISVPVSYTHPITQKNMESNNPLFIVKREEQFNTLLSAAQELILLLEKNPLSSIKYIGRFYG